LNPIEGSLATQKSVPGTTLGVAKNMVENVPNNYFSDLKSEDTSPASDEEHEDCGSRRCSFQCAVDNQIQQELCDYLVEY
jgi:hypothetical protein